MTGVDVKKYIIVLLSFLLIASIIFLITLTYSINIAKYFSQDVAITIVNAGDTEGQNGIYTKPLTDFTQTKYDSEKQRYYSVVELTGKSGLTDTSLTLREISFKLKSAESGNLTININYNNDLNDTNDKFSLNLVMGQVFRVTRTATTKFTTISENSKITISIVALNEESVANPDNIAFAIYDLGLKE